jgi:L-alanine-DL-glutamate epimerase-like enolase superfamily enzyme
MKIVSIDIYEVMGPQMAKTRWKPVIIKVNTDEGLCGFGEVGLAYGAGSAAGAGMVKELARYVIGMNPMNVEEIWEKLFRKTFWGMGGGTVVFGGMSAIDMACWDIRGKALGVPLYELLGGKMRSKLRAYASQIQFDWGKDNNRSLTKPEEYAEAARHAVADGYDAVKVDVACLNAAGQYAAESLEGILTNDQLKLFVDRVTAIREAVGPSVDIILEQHSFLGVSSAIQFARAVEDLGIFFYEEPIHPLNVDSMALVARSTKIPIASGERIYSRWGYRPFFEKQALAVIQPDLGLVGGITECKKVCDMAHIYDVRVQCHACGSPIITAASLHMEAVLPNFIIHENHRYNLLDHNIELCKYDYQAKDGSYEVPTLPGLGQEMSEKAMREAPCIHVAD